LSQLHATVGLVWGFFLNGVVFIGGQGGGQWLLPSYTMPIIGVAGGGTTGLAQLGIVVFVDWGCQGRLWGGMVGSGIGT